MPALWINGRANPALGCLIAAALRISVLPAVLGKYANGETRVSIDSNLLANQTVFIFQTSTHSPCFTLSDALMEMLFLAFHCRRSMALRVFLVIPCLPYSFVMETSRDFWRMSRAVGRMVDAVFTFALHSPHVVHNVCAVTFKGVPL